MRTAALAITLTLCAPVAAQERTVAIQNARVLTMTGDTLENATILLRGGKIRDVGTSVDTPPGAEVIDAQGGTVMPGLVSAWSRAGLKSSAPTSENQPTKSRRRWRSRRERSSGPAAKNNAATKVTDGLYARQDIFGELLECGITTLALRPDGVGFPGLGALVDPSGKTIDNLAISDEAFVMIAPSTGTKNKKLIEDGFEEARKLIEERNKPAEEEPAEEKKSEEKSEEKKEDAKKGDEKPADKKKEKGGKDEAKGEPTKEKSKSKKKAPSPNTEVLADLLEGKRRGLLQVSSASTWAHFADAAGETSFPRHALIVPRYSSREGRVDEILDQLSAFDGPILMPMSLTTPSYSRATINPAAMLADAGREVGFILSDRTSDVRRTFFDLMELVRYGLDRDTALAGVTRVPAVALGIQKRVGSIAKGLDADLLLFDRDPLDPTANLTRIWHKGQTVEDQQ